MKTRDTNRLLMYLAVDDHCALPANADAVTAIRGFAVAVDAFQLAVEGLQDRFSLSLQLKSTPSAQSKAALLSVLANEAAKLSGGVVTWALVNKESELASRTRISRSTLINAREIQAADLVEGLLTCINDIAKTNASGLADYGVSAELIDNVAVLNDRFNQMIGRPRSIIQARKRANKSIPLYIAKAEEQLGHMDRLARILEDTHPEFVAAYRDCRKVIHFAATRSLSPEEQANAEVRAAKEELLDANKALELGVILAKRDAALAQARLLRASLAQTASADQSATPDPADSLSS